MKAVSHDGGGFFSNLTKVVAYLSRSPSLTQVTWAMQSYSNGPFAYDVPEVFSTIYEPYGTETETLTNDIITSDPYVSALFANGSGQCITGGFQHDLYIRPDSLVWRRSLNTIYRKFFTYKSNVITRLEHYGSQLSKYKYRVAVISRGQPLAREQKSSRMPTRERYATIIDSYKQKYTASELVFFLCVDNLKDLTYYQEICSPYQVISTDIRRCETDSTEPHTTTIGSVEDIVDTVSEVELCSKCDALIHPVTNMATASLFMNPNQVSHYIY